MHTYYNKVESEEHMLYATEIAICFGINSEKDKPHGAFITKYLAEYIRQHIVGYKPLYYINMRGKANQVYSKEIYTDAMINLCRKMTERDKIYIVDSGDKNYKVKRVEV